MAEYMFPNVAYRATVYRTGAVDFGASYLHNQGIVMSILVV
jgi:hypothetical protein